MWSDWDQNLVSLWGETMKRKILLRFHSHIKVPDVFKGDTIEIN